MASETNNSIPVVVAGALGRMGSQVVQAVTNSNLCHLVAAIDTNKQFEGNDIGDEGAGRLGALGSMGSLTTLDLGWNNIGAEGAGRLAGALGSMGSLTTLDLEGNQIADEEVERIRELLANGRVSVTM